LAVKKRGKKWRNINVERKLSRRKKCRKLQDGIMKQIQILNERYYSKEMHVEELLNDLSLLVARRK
jgi:hypothetical protein